MNKRPGGIVGVLDGILTREHQQVAAATSAAAPQPEAAALVTDDRSLPRQAGSRRGRPLGKAKTLTQPKEKVTLWLSQPLVASYRDWSWEARSQLSHLIEKALTDYYRRNRSEKPIAR